MSMQIKAEIEQTFSLTIEGDAAAVVLYNARKTTLVGGLTHWQGRFDDNDAGPRDGHIVTLDEDPGIMEQIHFLIFGQCDGKNIVAASPRILEMAGLGMNAPAAITDAIPYLEALLERLRAFGDTAIPGGTVFLDLVAQLATFGQSHAEAVAAVRALPAAAADAPADAPEKAAA